MLTAMERQVMRLELEKALPKGYVAAFRWLGNREESRDACQEAAARAWAAAGRYDPAQPFYPWFYRILRNHCMDRLKGRRRSVSALEQLQQLTPRDQRPTAERQVLDQERGRALVGAVEALPEELKEVIELRHFQDLSYEEMAEIIGCPVGTVMSRLYRARQELRRALRETVGFFPAGREPGRRG